MEIRTKFKYREIILTLIEILEGLDYEIKVNGENELVYQNKLENRFVFNVGKFHDNTEYIVISIINSNGKYLIVDDLLVDSGRSWTSLGKMKSFLIEKNLKRNLEEAQKECDRRNGKYDRYSCVNCKFLRKDEEYPSEEHYKCVKCGYWFDTLEQADNNDNHNCLLPNYEGDEELPMYFEEKEKNNGIENRNKKL